MREEILRQLRQLAEEEYKAFNCKLIPGLDKKRVLGVRIPAVRKTAKKVIRADWKHYLAELENCEKDSQGIGGTDLYYEEVLMQAIVIGAAKMDRDLRLSYIERFVPMIDNWAVCDTFCGALKFADEEENRHAVWNFLKPYLASGKEYEIRFGAVMLLGHYIDQEHIDSVLNIMNAIRHDGYYVKMAVAWTLSVCYVKFPKETEALLRDNQLDDFTQNKTIQKIRESYRVSKEEKERLKGLKRK